MKDFWSFLIGAAVVVLLFVAFVTALEKIVANDTAAAITATLPIVQ